MSFPNGQGFAVVKSVLSGDCVVIRGRPVNGPPPEAIISLSNINAPRNQEPFAFESKEYLRSLLVGKQVAYKIDYTSASNRHIGSIKLEEDGDVARLIVKNGFARVKSLDTKKTINEEQLVLADLEKIAEEEKAGIWSGRAVERELINNWSESQDARSFLSKMSGKPIPAIIEQIRDGSTVRALLLLEGNVHQMITMCISGIQAPACRVGIPNMEDLVEPYGEEAKYFLETRILQRSVHVLLQSVTGQGNGIQFYGTIQHPAGNIAELLLSEGFAKVIDWNLNIVNNPAAYKAAESKARQKQLRIWKNVEPKPAKVDEKEYLAVVTKIVGPDLLVVEPVKTPGVEKKVQLSSIRGPKRTKNEAGFDTGYYSDAFEFLRSKLVGSKVLVKVDYTKPADGEYEQRDCVTITKNGKNISELLVQKGLASVLKHRKDDHNRSSFYDNLMQVEEVAIKEEKGIHSTKDLPVYRITDASENVGKARAFISQLQRHTSIKGIVEYVWSGSRFKIFLPSLSCRVTFILAGVQTPRPAGGKIKTGDAFGAEAAQFSSRKVFQREVEISVEGQDKVGGFIGSLTVPGNNSNLAVLLVEAGLSTVHHYSASSTPYANQLFAAEESAKASKLGLWEKYDVEAEKTAEQVGKLQVEEQRVTKEAIVSEVCRDENKIFLQVMGPELKQLQSMMAEFAVYHSKASQAVYSPKTGDFCSAQFSADNRWYRARILKANSAKKSYQVLYIDYGNSETLAGSRLRDLPAQFSTAKLKPQAVEATLAYIDLAPSDSEFYEECHQALCHFTEGKSMNATSLSKATPMNIILFNKNGISVNEYLLREGLATIKPATLKRYSQDLRKRPSGSPKSDLDGFVEAQEEAKQNRRNPESVEGFPKMNNILPDSTPRHDPLSMPEEHPSSIPFPFSDTDNSDAGVDSPREEMDIIRSKQELEQEKSILSGFLKKKGEQRRNWKSRYFVLRPTKLCYYKDEREYETLNLIPLAKIHSVSAIDLKKRKFVFGIVTRERIFYLGASSQTEMEQWIENIKTCVKNINPEARLSVGPPPALAHVELESDSEPTRKESNASTVSARGENLTRAALGISINSETPRASQSALTPTLSLPRQISAQSSSSEPPLRSSPVVNPSPLQQSWSHDRNVEAQISDFSEDDLEHSPQISPSGGPGDGTVYIQGYLYKQRTTLGGVKSWKKYWFVVRNGKLITYKNEQEYEAKRIVLLSEVIDVLDIDPINTKEFCFKLLFGKKSWVLAALSLEDRTNWLKVLEQQCIKLKTPE